MEPEQNEIQSKEEEKEDIKEKNLAFLGLISIGSKQLKVILFCVAIICLIFVALTFLLLPPSGFSRNASITIENGASLGQVSLLLSEEHLIRSRLVFEFCVMTIGGDKGVHAGRYVFKSPVNACDIAYRVTRGISGIPAVRVTIPEGLSNKEVAEVFKGKLASFDDMFFIEHARSLEGYIFPDTYFFSEDATTSQVEAVMRGNFDKKIEPILLKVEASGHPLREIVIMASILEKEARTPEDMTVVSGILWKRITRGMALQVDAPFLYLLGKTSSQLTVADLSMASAYNTYKNKGLPPGPIGNPGLVALEAAASPKESPYLYYLSDDDGVIHYAKTFEEHKLNKAKYLR